MFSTLYKSKIFYLNEQFAKLPTMEFKYATFEL